MCSSTTSDETANKSLANHAPKPYIGFGITGHCFFCETEDLLNDKDETSIIIGISALDLV